jgi:multidrug resistance efflux pump
MGGWRNKISSSSEGSQGSGATSQSARSNESAYTWLIAGGVPSDRPSTPEELTALREHVKFLDERFKSIDSLYKTGSRGGSADARARTGFELATAQAELATAEGHRDQAIAYSEQAERFAEEAMKAVTASYDAGRLALDTLLITAKSVSDSKRRLARLREPQSTVAEPQEPVSENGAAAKRNIAPRIVAADSNVSVSVSKALMQRTLQKYERIKKLAEMKVVPTEDVEAAKTDYDVSTAQYEHALRTLKFAQLEVQLAETELQEAASRPRTTGNSTDDFELKKLKIKLEMAKVKASEVE